MLFILERGLKICLFDSGNASDFIVILHIRMNVLCPVCQTVTFAAVQATYYRSLPTNFTFTFDVSQPPTVICSNKKRGRG